MGDPLCDVLYTLFEFRNILLTPFHLRGGFRLDKSVQFHDVDGGGGGQVHMARDQHQESSYTTKLFTIYES